MRTSFISLAAIALLAPAALADFEAGPLPLSRGSSWTYRSELAGEVTVSIDSARTFSGYRWFRLRGFNGAARWVRQTTTGTVYGGSSALWYRFGAAVGTSWTFRAGGQDAIVGSDGATLTLVSKDEQVTVPAGTFRAVHVRWRANGVADAGITDEWFVNGVGLVKRTETSIAGPRSMVLVRATVSGTSIPAAAPAVATGRFGIDGVVPASRVRLRVLLDQQLSRPAAAAFHPRDGSLWIVCRGDDSSVIVDAPGTAQQRVRRFQDDSDHFMNNPLALAFSRTRVEFATAQDTANDYNGKAAPNHFMGPTLWTADRQVYQGGAASHLDMLHHSCFAVGIAAGARPTAGPDRREYWVFNGESGCIDRYFFNAPHVLGGHDHADGETYRYGSGLRRVANVPGHLALDETSGVLYIADTGNGRVAKLDTKLPVTGATPTAGHHNETTIKRVPNATLASVTQTGVLSRPAGLILSGGLLVVSDHGTGRIVVLHPDGTVLGDADTGLGAGALMGLVEAPGGKLWALDGRGHRLVEVSVAP